MNWEKLVGEKVRNKKTGEVAKVQSYASKPSVIFKDKRSFCVGSPFADKWEVFEDDKQWNLADEEFEIPIPNTYPIMTDKYTKENVKKCRDLILKDVHDSIQGMVNEEGVFYKVVEICNLEKSINKRFGDL